MATLKEIDFDPFAGSPVDRALAAEGVTGKLADVARSIYTQESGGGKNTKTSNAGARGAMQLIPSTFASVADEGWDINDSEHNARTGVRYLKQLDKQSGGDPALTAAGYYGGPGGLEKARKGIAVSDPRNPGAPNTLEYGNQVAARVPKGAVAQMMDKVTDAVLPSAQAAQAPQDAKLYEVEHDPFAQPAAPAKRSMIEDLGRQLGLTARAAVTGAASIPAMVSDAVTAPINYGLDEIRGKGNGFRFQPAAQALNKVMTQAGVAVPENATERVVQDIWSSVVGAGSMIKGGAKLADIAAKPWVRGVGEVLAQGPRLQLASAATGAGASGVTREAGGGEGAQMVAGLAGAMAPSVLPYAKDAIIRGALRGGEAGRQRVEDTIKTFENAAGTVPTMGQATGSRSIQAAETALTNTVGSSGVMVRRAEEQAKAMGDSVQKLTAQLSPNASGTDAGAAIAAGSLAFRDNVKTTQQRLYAQLDNHIPAETRITSDRTQAALADLNADIAGAPELSKWFKNARIQGIEGGLKSDTGSIDAVLTRPGMADQVAKMRSQLESDAARITTANAERQSLGMSNLEPVLSPANIQEKIDGFLTQQIDTKLPYKSIKQLRTLVGRELSDTSLAPDVPRSKWRALYGALSDDLGDAAKSAGPKAEQVWARANQYTKASMERMDQLDKIVNKDAPEKVFKAATSGMADGGTTIRRVMKSMPLDNRREVTAAVLQRLGRAKDGLQNDAVDVFSSETFLTNLASMSPAARTAIFESSGFPGLGEKIAQMGRMSSVRRDGSKVFSNPSGTARQVGLTAWMSGLFTGISSGNPMTIAGALAVPVGANALARLTTNPKFVKFAAGQTALKEGTQAVAAGAALRSNNTSEQQNQESTLHEVDFDPFAQPPAAGADQQSPSGDPVRIELSGMAQPDSDQPAPDPEPDEQVISPAPDDQHSAAEFDPAHDFASQQRPDGTLALTGDAQALQTMLAAAGIPASSLVPMKGGLLIGKTQAGKVQEAIDRMNAPTPEVTATAPVDMPPEAMAGAAPAEGQGMPLEFASNQPLAPVDIAQTAINSGVEAPQETAMAPMDAQGVPQDMQMAQAGDAPPQAEAPAVAMSEPVQSAPVDRIQRLRNSGEHKVADMLQRSQDRAKTMGDVQTELSSMQAANPDLPHHGDPAFNDHYQQQRLAGSKPAEASAHAGMMSAMQLAAPQIGMPEAAVKALTAKLRDLPIDEAPGFVERFTQKLIDKGVMKPFNGVDQIATVLEHARDGAIHGALQGVYRDQPV
jgi:hypothetical protein